MAPVQVTVLDAAGRTVIGAIAPITLAMGANPSGASLEPGSATVVPTNGVATFTRYLRLFRFTEGNHTLTASSTGLPTVTSTPFVYLAAAPAQTKFITQPANGTAGQVLTPPVQVAIQDVHGNVVRSATATVTLSLLTNPAGGVLTGTRILTTTNGVATFTDLKLNKAGSGYRILAGSLLLTRSSTAEFSIAPGPADRLGFSVAPSTTAAGAAITPAVQVQVRDAFGNRVPGATNAVSMRIGTNPGGGSLSGTTLVSAVDGVATFPNLAISQPGIGYTLWATSTDLKLGRSPAFTVSAAVP